MNSFVVFIWLSFFFTNYRGCTADENELDTVILEFDDRENAFSEITQMALDGIDTSKFLLSVQGKTVGIYNFTVKPEMNIKRWSAEDSIIGSHWIEFQTPQQGMWWMDWKPSSCVYSNWDSSHAVSVAVTRSVSTGASYKKGFNLDFGFLSSRIIGQETRKINSISETAWYAIPGFGHGQVWSKQLMVWQDQQHRKCQRLKNGAEGTTCEPWSDYSRGNLPVQSGVNFEWVTDWSKINFDFCTHGTH